MSKRRFLPLALVAPVFVLSRCCSPGRAAPRTATFKAALVSDVGRFNDKGFNQAQLTGLKMAGDAARRLDPGDRVALGRRLHPEPRVAGPPGLRRDRRGGLPARRRGGDGREEVPEHPVRDHRLSGRDPAVLGQERASCSSRTSPGITFKSEQQSYLVGCLSALMAKKDGGNTISATGGVKIPPVDSFIAGYSAGAAKCVPGTKVLVGYSQDFIAQDKCKAVAQNQIAAGSQGRLRGRRPLWLRRARRRRRRQASGATASTSTSRTSARTS